MRDKIKLVSSAGTGHYYTTTKNKRNMPEKMEIKKFDPVVRQHVMYKEAKIKKRFQTYIEYKKPGIAGFFIGQIKEHHPAGAFTDPRAPVTDCRRCPPCISSQPLSSCWQRFRLPALVR